MLVCADYSFLKGVVVKFSIAKAACLFLLITSCGGSDHSHDESSIAIAKFVKKANSQKAVYIADTQDHQYTLTLSKSNHFDLTDLLDTSDKYDNLQSLQVCASSKVDNLTCSIGISNCCQKEAVFVNLPLQQDPDNENCFVGGIDKKKINKLYLEFSTKSEKLLFSSN